MVNNLIERQAAIDVLEERLQANGYSNVALVSELNRIIGYLMRLPSVQRKGEWIQKPNIYGVAYCSECDYELHTNNTNFCPNCGAEMKGEEDERIKNS